MMETEMKLWAVVIGRKGRHKRYVALMSPRSSNNLMAYEKRKDASVAAQELKRTGGTDVYVIPFVPTGRKARR